MKNCLSLFFLLLAFTGNAQIQSKKFVKRNVDTLSVFRPVVFVSAYQKKEIDTQQTHKIGQQIWRRVSHMLAKNYIVDTATDIKNEISEEQLLAFFKTLDTTNRKRVVSIPSFLNEASSSSKERYFLMTFFQGRYDERYQPYDNIKQGLAEDRLYIRGDLFYSDLRLLILDKRNNTVIYYDKKTSKMNDPRIADFVDQMILGIVRPIFYK